MTKPQPRKTKHATRQAAKYKVHADGETAYLPKKPVNPSMRELRVQIEIELGTHIRSTREPLNGNLITNQSELFEIACLLKIRKLLSVPKAKKSSNGIATA